MRDKFIYLLTVLLLSCSTVKEPTPKPPAASHETAKEFARGEVILATELLVKIFDKEMATLECVPDTEEASLLLRTIRPRMEVVEDDLEAMLDHKQEVAELIKTCEQNCTCGYVDDLLREHMVPLSIEEQKSLTSKRNKKEISRCLNYAQGTFCQSDLYKTLDIEKADFSFDEESL